MWKTAIGLLFLAFLLATFTVAAAQQPAIGVKPGDWVEYHVKNTGQVPAAQDLTYAKIEILDVEGEVFHANFTVRYVNGSLSSSIRTFNFTAGDVQAWIIIPANLNPSESFYDSSIGSTVAIQGQIQKTVAGATRTVTYVNSTSNGIERNKQWDKATGFYVQSVDNIGTYTVNAQAYATNIWQPQILGLDQAVFISLVVAAVVVLAVFLAVGAFLYQRRQRRCAPNQ